MRNLGLSTTAGGSSRAVAASIRWSCRAGRAAMRRWRSRAWRAGRRRGRGRRSASGRRPGSCGRGSGSGRRTRSAACARAGAAHDGPQVERANLVKGCRRREQRRFGVLPEDDRSGPVLPPLRRRQGDQSVAVHGQHRDPGHHVIESAVGLIPADAPAELLRQGEAVQRGPPGDERAQQRHFLHREVAPVIPALDLGAHHGPRDRAHLRSSLIDQGNHGDRFFGA